MPAVLASRNLPVGTRVSSRLSISERFLTGLLGVLRDISLDSADKYALRAMVKHHHNQEIHHCYICTAGSTESSRNQISYIPSDCVR